MAFKAFKAFQDSDYPHMTKSWLWSILTHWPRLSTHDQIRSILTTAPLAPFPPAFPCKPCNTQHTVTHNTGKQTRHPPGLQQNIQYTQYFCCCHVKMVGGTLMNRPSINDYFFSKGGCFLTKITEGTLTGRPLGPFSPGTPGLPASPWQRTQEGSWLWYQPDSTGNHHRGSELHLH